MPRFARRNFLFAISLLVGGLVFANNARAEEAVKPLKLRVMTYNVLCSFCDKKNYDPWEDRLHNHRDIIVRNALDLMALQEITKPEEVGQIAALNPEFTFVFYNETGGEKPKGYPDATLAYRTDRFEEIERGFYWFSETPDKPFTRGWAKAAFWRICAWARLKEKATGTEFYFSSTHYDNNKPNQENSAPLTLRKTEPFAEGMPVIVAGDYNSKPDSPAYAILAGGVEDKGFKLVNAYDIAKKREVIGQAEAVAGRSTDALGYQAADRIDHIWLGGAADFAVPVWVADLSVYGPLKRNPSDHVPIVAEIEIAPRAAALRP